MTLIEEDAPELETLIARIKSARRGRLINVYKLLLHSPPLAESWFEHNNAVRWSTELDGRLREMVIIRIGFLTKVAYVVNQHVPKLALAEGLTLPECEALEDWRACKLFSERDRAVLAYTDAMTKDIQVEDAVFADVRRYFSERQTVELTVLIGTYAMHTRVFEALKIDPEPA
ncbi:MAG TPA: carboxymuconolactone decarboxylase family protein [Micropepsaceae bacterium]|nr:carboxymuconolactone decarboxylase family protein [Micropepsaceae bacterium]